MDLKGFFDFGKNWADKYDEIVTPEQDAAFKAELNQFVTFALNALGAGAISFVTKLLSAQIAKLQAKINEMTAPKPPKP